MAIKRQDISSGGLNHYIESKCPVCGKKFEHTKVWAYWRGYEHARKYICSWGCTRAYDKKNPQKLKGA